MGRAAGATPLIDAPLQRLRRADIWPQALLISVCVAGCTPLIAGYSLDAYKNATSLKAETQALVDDSAEPYAQHATDVKNLQVKLNSAYEFANGIPKTQLSAQQWKIVADPDGALFGGFIKTWKKEGTTGEAYRTDKKAQIGQAFDFIACLEVNKQEAESCTPPGAK